MTATVILFAPNKAASDAFHRAVHFGYGPRAAAALRDQARREASGWERPSDTAVRVVRPPHASATVPSLDGAA